MIFGIEGQFGSGKTSTAVKMAERYGPNALVLTNIRVNTSLKPNWHIFGDDDLLEMLRVANIKDDAERMKYCEPRDDGAPFPYYHRGSFSDTVIILDEAGAIANNRQWKEFDAAICEYANQNRKMNADIIIVTADGSQVEFSLRRFVEDWVYVQPLFDFWIFKEFKVVRCRKKKKDGSPMMEYYIGKDDNGDWVTKERPLDWHMFWYFGPTTWRLYDDLHKNIRDSDKYLVSQSSVAVLREHFERRRLIEEGAIIEGTLSEHRAKFLLEWDGAPDRAPSIPKERRKFTQEEKRRFKARGQYDFKNPLDIETKVSDAVGA